MQTEEKDTLSTFMAQFWRIFSGPVLLLMTPLYLNAVEQGYWYTFTNLAALSLFADLGFATIVLQFAAHEFASLRFDLRKQISGDVRHIQRLGSLFRFTILWGLKVTGSAFVCIFIIGYVFLHKSITGDDVPWELIWGTYSLSSAIMFFNNILLTFFEGCNSVALVQKRRFQIAVICFGVTVGCLFFDFGIYTLAISGMANGLLGIYYLIKDWRIATIQLWQCAKGCAHNWSSEFLALIKRYALSCLGSYTMFNVPVPLAFHFYGAEISGHVGLSLAMWLAGFSIATSWTRAMVPRFNMLVENQRWKDLDRLFYNAFLKSVFTMILGGGAFLLIYWIWGKDIPIFQRVLSLRAMCILYIGWIGYVMIDDWAYYLRAHKKEPLMPFFIWSAFFVLGMMLCCVFWGDADYLFAGFLLDIIIGVPFIWRIYYNQKNAHFRSSETVG